MTSSASSIELILRVLPRADPAAPAFSGATTNEPGFTGTLSYTATDVFLTLNATLGAGIALSHIPLLSHSPFCQLTNPASNQSDVAELDVFL